MDASLLTNLFHIGPDAQTTVSVLEKIVRPILVYLFLVAGLRIAGKRELAQLNAFDLVVLLTLSNTVQNAIIGPDNSVLGGVIGATTLLVFNYVVVRFVLRHPSVERFLEGNASVLVRNGVQVEKVMRQEGITLEDLEAAARRQGFASLKEIDKAVLEATSGITFIAKKPRAREVHQQELMKRLSDLSLEIKAIREHLEGGRPPAPEQRPA